jgi:hypothetical protein
VATLNGELKEIEIGEFVERMALVAFQGRAVVVGLASLKGNVLVFSLSWAKV